MVSRIRYTIHGGGVMPTFLRLLRLVEVSKYLFSCLYTWLSLHGKFDAMARDRNGTN